MESPRKYQVDKGSSLLAWLLLFAMILVGAGAYIHSTSGWGFIQTLFASGATSNGTPAASPEVPPVNVEAPKPEPPKETKDQKHHRNAWEFFNGPITEITIEIDKENMDFLRKDARRYAECTIKHEDKVYKKVLVKLKGAAGSFKGIDDKPGMTLNCDKLKGGERFHGMRKFHLNNCAQDPTAMHEQLAGEWARAAGVPASRCTQVFVKLNDKNLGLYVFKEAFTKDFLDYFFANNDGNLYDGGFCREIGTDLEMDQGEGDRSDLKELIAASQEGDNAKRWERLSAILDTDRFAAFCAMESMTCHWDGYNFNRNNFRMYTDPDTKRMHFFMHGMDQTFNDANYPIHRDFGTLVGGAFMRCPEGKALYREKLDSIYQNVLKNTDWPGRAVEVGNRIREALATRDANAGNQYQGHINTVRDQMANRIKVLAKLLGDMPKPLEFGKDGVLVVDGTQWRGEGGGRVEEMEHKGRKTFRIRFEGSQNVSWRRSISVPPGRYRFEAAVACSDVQAVKSESGEGVGLRISGGNRHGQNSLAGSSDWKTVAYTFDTGGGDVVLVAEMRASAGDAWFDKESFRLIKVQ